MVRIPGTQTVLNIQMYKWAIQAAAVLFRVIKPYNSIVYKYDFIFASLTVIYNLGLTFFPLLSFIKLTKVQIPTV